MKPNATIGRRLSLQVTVGIVAVMIAFGTLMIIRDVRETTRLLDARQARTLRQLTVALEHPLWTLDKEQVDRTLRSYLVDPEIVSIKVLGGELVFSHFVRDRDSLDVRELAEEGTSVSPDGDLTVTSDTILRQGEALGVVEVAFSRQQISARRANALTVVGLSITLVVLVESLLIFLLVKKNVTTPIAELLRAATILSDTQDYSIRAKKIREDELGLLTDTFNNMLSTIENVKMELDRLIAELGRKNTELERFSYTVSHDLKSPLVTVSGFLGLLKQDALDGNREEIESDVEEIQAAVNAMQERLQALLELSRLGRVVDSLREVPLSELAREALSLINASVSKAGAQVDIEPSMPTVMADRQRLLEVLQNLMENAVKFMGDQPLPHVEIGARKETHETVCHVRDNGTGVDPRHHEKIFGLFERLDDRTEGTGIGLASVKRIVEAHGGRIWIESVGRGHGSVFYFTIPHGSKVDLGGNLGKLQIRNLR